MNTWWENLFILEAIRSRLDQLPSLFNDDWPRYQYRLMYWADRLVGAQSHVEVSLAVDSLIDELLESPAAGFVREILQKSESKDEDYRQRKSEICNLWDVPRSASAADDQASLDAILGSSTLLRSALYSVGEVPINAGGSPVPADPMDSGGGEPTGEDDVEEGALLSNVPPAERRINAWIARSEEHAHEPLRRGEVYELDFKVGEHVEPSMITGPDSVVSPSDIPEEGLQTKWVVMSPAIDLHELPNEIPVTIRRETKLPQVATFSLLIPHAGDSVTVRLGIKLPLEGSIELSVVIYAWPKHGSEANQELYRQFNIRLPVADNLVSFTTPDPPLIKDEAVHVPAPQLNLRTTHEWTTPPGKLTIAVTGQGSAYVTGTAGPYSPDGPVQWHGVQGAVAGPIQNVRSSAERFRGKWENYLNDIDPQHLANSLQNFQRHYDWANLNYDADAAHDQSWSAAAASPELFDLAFDGYALYQRFFPAGTELRTWLDALTPGQRLSISWMSTSGAGWIAHIPWGLMYRSDPVPGAPIDPMEFLGLRYRISYTAHAVQAPSRALGTVDKSHTVTLLYWGQQAQDPTALEAQWQKNQFANWPTQVFVPSSASVDAPKTQLINMLSIPTPSPVAVIYFFCQCSVGTGNDPVLRFGDSAQVSDVLRRTELTRKALADRPIVFANACTTTASDPYIANELEELFFDRQCRAYIGTESKVPIPLASRVAYVFFNFLYRKVDPDPMAAGEALAQTRLFLWTRYRNIGGLFYTYVNQYDLYMAADAEVLSLKL